MPEKKPQDRLPKRIKKREVEQVTFTLDGFDAPFTLPALKLNFGEARRIHGVQDKDGRFIVQPDTSVLTDYLTRHDAAAYVDLLDELEGEEIEAFMKAWTEASGDDLGESSPPAS